MISTTPPDCPLTAFKRRPAWASRRRIITAMAIATAYACSVLHGQVCLAASGDVNSMGALPDELFSQKSSQASQGTSTQNEQSTQSRKAEISEQESGPKSEEQSGTTPAQQVQNAGAPQQMQEPQLPDVDNALSNTMDQTVPLSSDSQQPKDRGNNQNLASLSTPALMNTKPAAPTIAQVIQNYKAGKYRDALSMISKMKPSDKTHYWTGLCYQGQNQLRQASAEFQWVASYSRDPQLKYNAERAILAVSRYAQGRTYTGQGNTFSRPVYTGGGGGGGGGGGRG